MASLMEDEVFKAFSTYAAIVILKMMLMGPMTGYFRFTRGVGGVEPPAHATHDTVKLFDIRSSVLYSKVQQIQEVQLG